MSSKSIAELKAIILVIVDVEETVLEIVLLPNISLVIVETLLRIRFIVERNSHSLDIRILSSLLVLL